MKAGFAARLAPEFDVWAQARAVDAQVKTEQKVHWWPIAVGAPALALPRGYFLTIGATAFWLGSVLKARGRAYQLRRQLERDLAKRGRQASLETDRLIAHADAGDEEAVFALFGRWLAIRPDVLSTLELDLHALSEDGERGDWLIEGDAITRTQLVNSLPESGPTQRSVMGERSPAAIDKELAEVNAAAVLSVLWALFSGPSPQRVRVRLMLTPPDGSEAMQWVWLRATVNERRLRSAIDDQTSAVDT
ncbi:MAG: hypothetical protein ABIT38_08915, partial [Gemmatimonadaceae bacterium]